MSAELRYITHLLASFGCAWFMTHSVATKPIRERILDRLKKRYTDPDCNAIAAHLTVFFTCAKCQSFWYGALLSPIATGALPFVGSAPWPTALAWAVVHGLCAYTFAVLVFHNMRRPLDL